MIPKNQRRSRPLIRLVGCVFVALQTVGATSGATDPQALGYSAAMQGIESSRPASRKTLVRPSITEQPVDQFVFLGATAVFHVAAIGTPPLYYQWRLNGKEIRNSTLDTLTIQNVGLANLGVYDVVVYNGRGIATSNTARLTSAYSLATVPSSGGSISISPVQTSYASNSIVTVTARPDPGYVFDKWTGDTMSTDNPVLIEMNTNKTVTARFVVDGTPFVSIDGQPATRFEFMDRDSVTVEIATTFANGSIFYTLDGTEPQLSSTLYSGPFDLTNSAVVRAIAYSTSLTTRSSSPVPIDLWFMRDLTVSTKGGGTISVSPPEGPYRSDVEVTLEAIPKPGWSFLEWNGDVTGNSSQIILLMDRSRTVEAVFGTSITTMTSGSGSIVLNPLLTEYPYGTVVQIHAIPREGRFFGLWGINGKGNQSPFELTVTNSHPSFSALFAPLEPGKQSLATVSNGRGTIAILPQGNVFETGQEVTLTAMPHPGATFLAWTGNASGTDDSITVTMNASKVITANFSGGTPLLRLGKPLWSSGDALRISLQGEPYRGFVLEYSEDLKNWIPLDTTLLGGDGLGEVSDPNPKAVFNRFYRAISE